MERPRLIWFLCLALLLLTTFAALCGYLVAIFLESFYALILFLILILPVVFLFGRSFSKNITDSLTQMRQIVDNLGNTDFSQKATAADSLELAQLADTLNTTSRKLDTRMQEIVGRSNQLQAVLSSMLEGVIAFDSNEQLIIINEAAANILKVNISSSYGLVLQEVVRNYEMQKFILRASREMKVQEQVIAYGHNDERFLQLQAVPLHDAEAVDFGVLVVFSDITELRRLESVRQDFVANVSHELRTPITSIKGFAETLLEGALDNRDDAKRFVEIIAKYSDRLQTVINDLLKLARIEQDAEIAELERQEVEIRELLWSVKDFCQNQIREKAIVLLIDCINGQTINVNRPLIEQALINLLENALKYSDQGKNVLLLARQAEQETTIQVQDWGCGIAKEHLSKLFERFYRVDKSRSRKIGGTGLGLAIVRHVAVAHGGEVTVESKLGEGSVFTLRLPRDI